MKRYGPMALAIAAVLAACSNLSGEGPDRAASVPGPVPGEVTFAAPPANAPSAPSFELPLLDGGSVDTADESEQRPIVLVFFETRCEQCRTQQREINAVAEEFGDIVLFVGVAGRSEPEDLRAYVTENEITYPVGADTDGDIWLQYAVEEPPLVVLVSRGGRLVRGWPGGVAGPALRDQIDQMVLAPTP